MYAYHEDCVMRNKLFFYLLIFNQYRVAYFPFSKYSLLPAVSDIEIKISESEWRQVALSYLMNAIRGPTNLPTN